MKRAFIPLFIILLLSMTMENDKSKFTGKWAGEDEKEIGYLNFEASGYASFEIRGQVFGGKEFVFHGKKASMTYQVNNKTNPINIDLIITMLETGEQKKLLCIANFFDHDTMEFAISFEENRPTTFDPKNSIIFKRE